MGSRQRDIYCFELYPYSFLFHTVFPVPVFSFWPLNLIRGCQLSIPFSFHTIFPTPYIFFVFPVKVPPTYGPLLIIRPL